MTLAFIKQINEYVIEATMEASDEEILACIDSNGFPSHQDILKVSEMITLAVKEQRQSRLTQQKVAFQAYKQGQKTTRNLSSGRSIPKMLSDIVGAMQNQNDLPQGITLAFREQSQDGSEDDIHKIWQSLVELGLIDPNDE